MRIFTRVVVALSASLWCGLLLAKEPLAVDRVQTQVLLEASSSWDGTLYGAYPAGPAKVTLVRLRIAPGTTLPWHRHPMPNVAYVVAGELTVEKQSDGSQRHLKPGDVLAEMVETVHRGISGDQWVELLVFYAGTVTQPLSVLP